MRKTIFPQIKVIPILILVVLSVFLSFSKSLAQEHDLGTWIDLEAMHETGHVAYGLMGEFYTKDKNTSVERVSVGVKAGYPLSKTWNCNIGYLLMNYYKTGYTELRNRVYLQAEYKKRISNWAFGLRERMQVTFYPETMESSKEVCSYWRNRFKVEYRNSNWKVVPVADVESFYLVGKGSENGFDEFRYSLGVSFKLSKNQELKVYGMLSDTSDLQFYILGLAYDLNL